jgi:transketolase
LDNLIVIYDSNDICLDGDLSECFSENVATRYEAYGWNVQTIDGHNFDDIERSVDRAKAAGSPSLIIAKTTIGYGSPSFAGTSEVHGKALGAEENKRTKENLDISLESFYVSEEIKENFKDKESLNIKVYDEWTKEYKNWEKKHPKLAKQLNSDIIDTSIIDTLLKELTIKPGLATRASSNAVIQKVTESLPKIIGGSADLSCSDSTGIKHSSFVSKTSYNQRNIKYGVREFAMGAIASGLALSGFFKPFCGTFLTFSDYMKNAIRLAALMNINVIYQFTHDSILLGEDGPTHQPVEHLASLRSIPNVTVLRPADTTEVKAAWSIALQAENPVALILTRQGVPDLDNSNFDSVKKGAYILKEATSSKIDYCFIATGSEVSLALTVAEELESDGKSVQVVSMPSFELFDAQKKEYQDSILPPAIKQFISIEAQSSFGWHKYVGRDGLCISVDSFGLSAPAKDLKEIYGFTKEAILEKIRKL